MSTMSNEDQSFILEALPAFLSEASEQLATVEQLLLALEESPCDREMLDALFRCVHTVKGSAGIFGLMGVVEFTHHVETLLDKVREGQVALTPSLGTLLLESADTIRHLIQVAGTQAHPFWCAGAAGSEGDQGGGGGQLDRRRRPLHRHDREAVAEIMRAARGSDRHLRIDACTALCMLHLRSGEEPR